MNAMVAVVMPAYNEAAGIADFLREINNALDGFDLQFIVADDCSNDETVAVLDRLTEELPVEVLSGARNTGHGPTTLRALRAGLASGAEVVAAVDGDGQFYGSDIRLVIEALLNGEGDVIEGVRSGREDPLFRRLTSWATRTLVQFRAHSRPVDANTPLRVYRPSTLMRLLSVVPEDSMVPNLVISAVCRTWRLTVLEIPVNSIPRRGGDVVGSTWQARRKSVPSKRFLRFCLRASWEWANLPASPP